MQQVNKIVYLTVIMLLIKGSVLAQTSEFYVSPTGNNSAPGSKEKPWKTLEYAKNKARSVNGPTTIYLSGGTYTLSKTLVLNGADSNLSIKALPGETPIISGGVKVGNWRKGKNGIWSARVPRVAVGRNLYVNGKSATRARTKNGDGWVRHSGQPSPCNSVWCRDDEKMPNGFTMPDDFPELSNVGDVEMVNIMRWKMYRGKLDRIENNVAYVSQAYWDLAKIGPYAILFNSKEHTVTWLENAIEFLDEEGEWFLDKRKRTLYYKPKQGENLNNATVVLSNVEKLIDADGVHNVTLEGLTFKHGDWNQASTPQGYVSIQSGAILTDPDYKSIEDAFEGLTDAPGSVHFKNSRNVIISGNTFQELGGTALNFDTNNQYINIFGNTFDHISGGAITIGNLQDHHIVEHYRSKEIIIDNNRIQDIGYEYYDLCAIKCSYVTDAAIVNNTIAGTSSGAISTGWGWGRYDVDNFDFWKDGSDKAYNHPSVAGGVLVAHNNIQNITNKLGDTGAIYNLGASPGSKWYANFIENINLPSTPHSSHNVHGIYTDNGSRGIEIQDNVVINGREPYLANGSHNYNVRGSRYYYAEEAGTYPEWVKEKSGIQAGITAPRSRADIEKLMPAELPVASKFQIVKKGVAVGRKITAEGSAANSKASYTTDGKTETFWQGAGKEGALILDLGKISDIHYVNSAFGYIDAVTKREVYCRYGYDFEYFTSLDGENWTSYGEGRKISTIAINQQYNKDYKPVEARYVKLKVYSSGKHPLNVLRFKVVDQQPIYGGLVRK